MTIPTISSTVLDHVRAYAAQVRAHLGDLSPEQVDDLTDGLEADLAEALADTAGPVATGEIPVVSGDASGAAAAGGASVLDLTRRFGPAASYAAELRASAGLGEAVGPGTGAPRLRAPGPAARLRGHLAARWARARGRAGVRVAEWREALAPFLGTPQGIALRGVLASLVPLWWILRAWVWFVIVAGLFGGDGVDRLVPRNGFTWLVLVALVVASVAVGRRPRSERRWERRLIATASVLAVLWAPWAMSELQAAIAGGADGRSYVEYVEVPVYSETPVEPADGVYVDGMLVSNLFVYDADGNPLERVQIFDDRGRPVRTTLDEGTEAWWMPGVDGPWFFGAAMTTDGRERWNVYPLRGVPVAEAEGTEGAQRELSLPPLPFAKAPALADVAAPVDDGAEGAPSTPQGEG